MANTLDFNRYRPPIFPLKMMDENRTVLHLVPPTVDLIEELRAHQTELWGLLSKEDDTIVNGLFELAAKLMSCNRNMKKITPDQIRDPYGLDEEDLVIFYEQYADFLKEIENAKN